jgi:hypothetical protein
MESRWDMSPVDALLAFVMTYSTTYVVYCWLHPGAPAREHPKSSAGQARPEQQRRGAGTESSYPV